MSEEAEFHTDSESIGGKSVRALCAELDAKEVLSSTHPIIRQFMCSYQRQGEHLKRFDYSVVAPYATSLPKVSEDAEFHTDSESTDGCSLAALCAELG